MLKRDPDSRSDTWYWRRALINEALCPGVAVREQIKRDGQHLWLYRLWLLCQAYRPSQTVCEWMREARAREHEREGGVM